MRDCDSRWRWEDAREMMVGSMLAEDISLQNESTDMLQQLYLHRGRGAVFVCASPAKRCHKNAATFR
jgi:hypothetical protein